MSHESSSTVGQLLLELAVRVGLARQSSSASAPLALPTEATTVTQLRFALSNGAKRVARYRLWSWLTQTIRVTCDHTGQSPDCVNSHPGDYWIDREAARAASKKLTVTYASGGGGTADIVSEHVLETARARSATATGYPAMAAFVYDRPKSDGDRVRGRIVMKLYPKPDAAHVIAVEVHKDLPDLVETTERPWWPSAVDEAVLAAAVEYMARYGKTATAINREEAEAYTMRVLQEVARLDRVQQASYRGTMGGTTTVSRAEAPGILSDGGVIITG